MASIKIDTKNKTLQFIEEDEFRNSDHIIYVQYGYYYNKLLPIITSIMENTSYISYDTGSSYRYAYYKINKFESSMDFEIEYIEIDDTLVTTNLIDKVVVQVLKEEPSRVFTFDEFTNIVLNSLNIVYLKIDNENYIRQYNIQEKNKPIAPNTEFSYLTSIIKNLIDEKYKDNKEELILAYNQMFVDADEVRTSRYYYSSLCCIKFAEKTFRYIMRTKKYSLKKFTNLASTINSLMKKPDFEDFLTDELLKKYGNTSLDNINHFNSDEEFDLFTKVVDKYHYIHQELNKITNNNYEYQSSKLSTIHSLYLLCRYYGYDLDELADYIISLPFAQGITSRDTTSILYMLNLFGDVNKDNKYPSNLSTLNKKYIQNKSIYTCTFCNSISLNNECDCPICGHKSYNEAYCRREIDNFNYLLSQKDHFFFYKVDIKNLFEMNIEYFSAKKNNKYSYVFIPFDRILYKMIRHGLNDEDIKKSDLFSHTIVNIDFKNEEKIYVKRNGRKYNNLNQISLALGELDNIINDTLNTSISKSEICSLYESPCLELLYKTKYKDIVPHIAANKSTILGKYISNDCTSIKEIFKNRNKQELDIALDFYNKYKHNVKYAMFDDMFIDLFFGLKEHKKYKLITFNQKIELYSMVCDIYLNNGTSISLLTLYNKLEYLFDKGYTFTKLLKYIKLNMDEKLFIDLNNMLIYLEDYRKSLDLLNPDNDPNVRYDLYPKDLILSHDRAAFMYSMKKNEIIEQNFIKHAIINKEYEYHPEKDKFIIIAPDKTEDLKIEGLTLSHCVGTYINAFAEGRSKIFFMREADKPNVPLVTIEINQYNELIQARGKHNRTLNLEENKFLNKWFNNVVKRKAA